MEAAQLLLFSSHDDCPACEISMPVIKRVAKKRGVSLEEHDPVEEPSVAQRYNVRVLPTVVLLNGQKEFCGELHGVMSEDLIERLLNCV